MADPHVAEYPMRYMTTVCYDGTMPGEFLARSIHFYSIFFFVFTSLRYFPLGPFIILYLATYYQQVWIHIVLSEIFQQEKPNPHCNPGYGLPCLESQVIAYVAAFILIYAHRFQHPLSVGKRILTVVFFLYIFFALIWTGNYTFTQTLAGAVIGFFSALLNVAVIEKFVYPDFATIREWRVMRWTGYNADALGPARDRPRSVEDPPPEATPDTFRFNPKEEAAPYT